MGVRGSLFQAVGLAALMACSACGSVAQHARKAGTPPYGTVLKQHGVTLPSKADGSLVRKSSVLQLPRAVSNFGAALHDGALYLFGGYFGEPNEYALDGQSGELLRIDVATGSIESLADGMGAQGAPLVSTSAGLLRVGGMRAENVRGEPERVVSLADIARFDAERAQWQPFAELPQARSSHAALVHDAKLYVIGGFTLSGIRNTGVFNQDMLVLDLQSGAWSSVAQPFRTRALAAGVLNGKLVVVGGLTENGKVSNEVHLFDPATQVWSRGADYPEDTFGIAIASTGTRLYASARDGIVHELDADGRWLPTSALGFPRFSHQLVALDDTHLCALGGLSGMHHGAPVSHVEQLDLADPSARVMRFSLRNPLRTKSSLGVQVVDDALVVFDAQAHDALPVSVNAGAPIDAISLDLASLRAEAIDALPVRRQAVQTVALEGQLLALGGVSDDGKQAYADGVLFDVGSGRWSAFPFALPEARSQFALLERQAEVWVFGGLLTANQNTKVVQVLRSRPDEPFVDAGFSMPRARAAFGAAQLNDQLFMVGGVDEQQRPVTQCDALAFARAEWSTFPCPQPRVAPQLVALGGQLYLAGGAALQGSPPVLHDSIERYDPVQGSWSTLLEHAPITSPELRMRTYHHALLLFASPRGDDDMQLAMIVPPLAAL